MFNLPCNLAKTISNRRAYRLVLTATVHLGFSCFAYRHFTSASLASISSGSCFSNKSSGECAMPFPNLLFDNRNLHSLPLDTSNINRSRQVPDAIFSLVDPTPVQHPKLVAASTRALELLGIKNCEDEDLLAEYFSGQLGDGAAIYLGEVINPSSAERWELQLKGAGPTPFSRSADGRKVLRSSIREFLASEAMDALNIPTTRAGTCVTSDSTVIRDPYYDGRTVAEKCTVVSRIAPNFFRFGSFEIFKEKPVASTSEGKGDYYRAGPSAGNDALKKQLFDYILLYYPELIVVEHSNTSKDKSEEQKMEKGMTIYDRLFHEIVTRTARLVAQWQSVGFVHGVMNTDNMSVMGLTIDYGPYGFMEYFDEQFVPNGSDGTARYCYQQQPAMGRWNVQRLAEALTPFLTPQFAAESIASYDSVYREAYLSKMRDKLGLLSSCEGDEALINELFTTMQDTSVDFTDLFVLLTELQHRLTAKHCESRKMEQVVDEEEKVWLVSRLVATSASPQTLVKLAKKKQRIHRLSMQPSQIMQLHALLHDNSRSDKELAALFGDAPIDAVREEIDQEKRKLDLLVASVNSKQKYEQMSGEAKKIVDTGLWTAWCDKYLLRLEEDVRQVVEEVQEDFLASLSGTTEAVAGKETKEMRFYLAKQRSNSMDRANPKFILRQWILQQAIDQAEKGEFRDVQVLLSMSEHPFRREYIRNILESAVNSCESAAATTTRGAKDDESAFGNGVSDEERQFLQPSPEWADSLYCTCSS